MNNKNTFYTAITDSRLSTSSKVLYSFIFAATEFSPQGYCDSTNKKITESIQLSKSTITTCIEQLKEFNYITQVDIKRVRTQDGLFSSSNGEAYRQLHPSNITVTPKAKKVLDWRKDETFVKFYKMYVSGSIKTGNDNQATAYRLYIKIDNKEELITNTKEYLAQSKAADTYTKNISSWLNNTKQYWINDIYIPNHKSQAGNRTEQQESNRQLQNMKDDIRTIQMLQNQLGKDTPREEIKKYVIDMYKKNTYNKVTIFINKLENKLG